MRRFSRFFSIMFLVSVAILITGCRSAQQISPNQSSILFDLVPSKGVAVTSLRTQEESGQTVISGKVKRTFNNCCDASRGHIDIAVIAPDEIVLDTISTLYTPRDMPRVRSRASHFTASLPYTLPEDVMVRIIYHENSGPPTSLTNSGHPFICERNIIHQEG